MIQVGTDTRSDDAWGNDCPNYVKQLRTRENNLSLSNRLYWHLGLTQKVIIVTVGTDTHSFDIVRSICPYYVKWMCTKDNN